MSRVDTAVELLREMSLQEAARRFGCSTSELRRRIETEDFLAGRVRRTPGGQYRIPLAAMFEAQGIRVDVLDETDRGERHGHPLAGDGAVAGRDPSGLGRSPGRGRSDGTVTEPSQ